MKYNRILVFGGNGMLGGYIKEVFRDQEVLVTDVEVSKGVKKCDVSDYVEVEKYVKLFNPDLILNLAAMTDLEECEKKYVQCIDSNYRGCVNGYKVAREKNIPYIFISTAGVFGGEKDFYVDEDKQDPLSNYAVSKYLSEKYLEECGYKGVWVFRAGWMMGGGVKKDKKFVNKFMKQVREGKKVLHVVDDKLGTPTYCKDFAASIKRHVEEELPFGLYNMVSKGDASRYDVAVKIKELLNLDITVEKVDSGYFKEEYFARRPLSERLINEKLNNLGRNYMRSWEEALTDYLTNDYGK